MRTLGACLVVLLASSAATARAQTPCGPLSFDASCQRLTPRQFTVDFGQGQKPGGPMRLRIEQSPTKPVATGHGMPLDCQMIRPADPTLDARMEKPAPSAARYPLRIIEVPSCAATSAPRPPR